MKTHCLTLAGGLILAGLCASCLNLKPDANRTRFYLLSTIRPADIESAPASGRDELPLAIHRVAIPSYLNAPWIMVRQGGNELAYSDFDQWAEPVGDGVIRATAQNLALLLQTSDISIQPRILPDESRYSITVELLQFELSMEGGVRTEANWRITNPGAGFQKSGRFSHSRPCEYNPEDYTAAVAALSANLADLCREIAGALSPETGLRTTQP